MRRQPSTHLARRLRKLPDASLARVARGLEVAITGTSAADGIRLDIGPASGVELVRYRAARRRTRAEIQRRENATL